MNSSWPDFDTLVQRAEHQYFRELFQRPFKTYILSAYSEPSGDFTNHYFTDGMTTADYQDEVSQFYNFSKYLLETYDGTGKEFILQHWQGDWAIIGSYDRSEEPTDTAIQGMIEWLNARQEGVTQAREDVESDVTVLHAAEVNIVLGAMEDGERRVTNKVLPETNVDLVSHNSYEEMHRGYVPPNPNNQGGRPSVTPPEQVDLMRSALDYVNEYTPDPTPYVRDSLVEPDKNVFLGEYGFPEVTKGTRGQTRQSILMTEVALDWGARWVVYWQLYDNEDVGFWLIRDDETKTPTYRYFEKLISKNIVPQSPQYVRVDLVFDRLVDERAFACSEIQLGTSGKVYNVGTPIEEPNIWNGSFWTHETEERTWRWFGGNDKRTILFFRADEFAGADRLRLRGHPREASIGAIVEVNGEQTDSIVFEENRWRDWEVTLKTETPTPSPNTSTRTKTSTRTPTNTAKAPGSSPSITPTSTSARTTTSPDATSPSPGTIPSTTVETPGFGFHAVPTAIALAVYWKLRDH